VNPLRWSGALTKTIIRCAVYTRKSSEEGLEQSFNSLDAQREACVAYVESQKHEGWSVVKERYDDGAYSGGTMERPALKRILSDVSAGKIETIIVYKVDRLTRSLSDFAKIIEVFDSHQVSFVSVTQQFNTTTSMGRLTLNVLLSFAQFERELTGERIRDKVAASKKKGMWMGGVVPLGYDRVERRLVVNGPDADTVREIFRQYMRLGCVQKLRDYLEKHRIYSKVRTSSTGHTSGGGVYSRGALYCLLNNRIYIGEIVHREQAYPGQHDPIISRKLWDQVAARLQANNQAHRTSTIQSTSSLLSGILWDHNGIRFTPTHAVKNGKRYRYYTSQAVIQNRGGQPRVARYPAVELEGLVTSQIHRLLGSFEKDLTGNKKRPQVEMALQSAKDLADKWPDLTTFKQQEFIRAAVRTVTLSQRNIWIEVDKVKIVRTLLGTSPAEFPESENRKPAVINLTAHFQPIWRGAELRICVPDNQSTTRRPDPALVKAIARARMWYVHLISGEASSVDELARRSGFKCRYVRKILQSAVLSPQIFEAILSGQQACHLSVKNLQSDLPLDWHHQARELLVTSLMD
jgi:DNA invertase Pin-like site-specific DNA recombinase